MNNLKVSHYFIAIYSFISLISLQAQTKPNIIVLLADDHGYGDLSAMEIHAPDISTPNLDKLAASGTLFTHGYSSHPVCSPSRAGQMTGRYQSRWGNTWYGKADGLPLSEITLAEALKEHGYATGYIGKIHYGKDFHNTNSPLYPMNHGFDYTYGFPAHTIHFLKHSKKEAKAMGKAAGKLGVGPMWENDKKDEPHGYATEIFGEKAREFITKNKEKPFFLHLAFNAVHNYVGQLPDDWLKNNNMDGFEDWNPKKEEYLTWYKRVLNCASPMNNDPMMRKWYLGCLDYLDLEVGKIVNHLEKNGLRDNTIIFYASDNGGSPRTAAYNGGLAGCKYTLAEGGIRIPYFISWPGKVKAGIVSNKPVITLDIFPTAMAAATGNNNASPQCDGINLLAFLCGKDKLQERDPIGWQAKSEYALRHRNWKLYITPRNFKVNVSQVIPQNKRLFDLENDPRQENNLYLTMPEKALEMEKLFREWKTQYLLAQPAKNRRKEK